MKTALYLAVIIGLLLAGCAPGQLERALGVGAQGGSPEPTQVLDTLSGYPGPTAAAPTSPVPIASPQLPFAPPLSSQQVTIGEITEVASFSPGQTIRYTVESVFPKFPYTEPQPLSVIIHDLQTGASIRLGDDQGDVGFEYLTEQYVFWRYTCLPDTCSIDLKLKTGLYAHNLETGQDIWIGPGAAPEAQADWVIYITQEEAVSPVSLRVRHLITGEDFELSTNLVTVPGYGNRSFYAINEGRVAWAELDPATGARTLRTYDLNTRTEQKPDAAIEFPRALAVSDSLIVWFDGYWQGYDLRQGSQFNVPPMPMPTDLWDESLYIRVAAQGDRLQWTLDVQDGTDLFYTARVSPLGQPAPPTPQESPTAVPEATLPMPGPSPTASPEIPAAIPTELPTAYP